jgi:hypothetical protein
MKTAVCYRPAYLKVTTQQELQNLFYDESTFVLRPAVSGTATATKLRYSREGRSKVCLSAALIPDLLIKNKSRRTAKIPRYFACILPISFICRHQPNVRGFTGNDLSISMQLISCMRSHI